VTGDARAIGLCALHGVDAEVDLSEDELTISSTAAEPSVERDRRRRSFVRDARRLLPISTVRITQTYRE